MPTPNWLPTHEEGNTLVPVEQAVLHPRNALRYGGIPAGLITLVKNYGLATAVLFGAEEITPQKTSADDKVVASFAPAITYDNPAQLVKDGLHAPPESDWIDPNFPGKIMIQNRDNWWIVVSPDGTLLRWRDKVEIAKIDPRIAQSVQTLKDHLFGLKPLPPLATADVAKEFYAEQAKATTTQAAPAPSVTENVRSYDDFNALRVAYKWRAPNNNGYTAQGYTDCFWVQDDRERWYKFERDGKVTCENTNEVVGYVDPRAVESIDAIKKYILGGAQLPSLATTAPAPSAKSVAAPEKAASYDDLDTLLVKLDARNPWGMWKDEKTPGGFQFVDNLDRWIMVTPDGYMRLQSTGDAVGRIDPTLVSSIPGRVTALRASVQEQQAPPYDDYIQMRELVQPPEDFSWTQEQFPGHIMVQTKTKQKLWVKINQQTGVMTRVRDGLYMGRIDPRIVRTEQTTKSILFSDGKLPADGSDPPTYEELGLGTQASGHAFDEDLKMGIWNMYPQIKINAAAANRSASTMRSAEETFRKAPGLIGVMAKAAFDEVYKEKLGKGTASLDAVQRAAATYRHVAEVSEFVSGLPSAKDMLDLLRHPDVFNTYYKIYSGKAAAESKQLTIANQKAGNAASQPTKNISSNNTIENIKKNKDSLIPAWDKQHGKGTGAVIFDRLMQGYSLDEAIYVAKNGLQTAQNNLPAGVTAGHTVAIGGSPQTQEEFLKEITASSYPLELDKSPQPEDVTYNIPIIAVDRTEPLDVEMDAKGNVIVNFELANETKMVSLFQEPGSISTTGTLSRPNLSLTLEGKSLAMPYTSFKSFGSAESISAPLPPGKYTLRVSDVMNYYQNAAQGAHYKFKIEFNIKKFDSRNIEAVVTREDHPKAMKVSMKKVEFEKSETGRWEIVPAQRIKAVDKDITTWLTIHGRNDKSSSGKMRELSSAISECGFQVIECDWSEGASDNSLLTLQPLAGKKWIEKSADKYFQLLKFMGFSGDKIIEGVHSWGTPMGYEIAELFRQENGFGVQGFVSLDAAQDPAELLGLTEKQLDISAICKSSESFYGSQWGSAFRTLRSHKSSMIISPPRLTANEMHAGVITAYANLLRLQKIQNNEVGLHYQVSELLKDKRQVPCKDQLDRWIWVDCEQIKEDEDGKRYRNAKPYQLTTSNPFDDNEDDPLYNSDLSLLD